MSKDIIYREDAIKEIEEYIINENQAVSEHPDDIFKYNSGLLTAMQVVYNLSSADRPQGKWTNKKLNAVDSKWERYTCSVCGKHSYQYDFCPNYCPNCGAKMEEADDE